MSLMSDIFNFFFGEHQHHEHHHHHRRHHKHRHAHQTDLVIASISYNNLTIKTTNTMSLALNVQEFVTSTLGLVDHVTQAPVDATFSNQANTSDNEAVATVDPSGRVSAASAGTANITFTADASYTNSLGAPVTETKSVLVAVTVSEVVVANGTDLIVTFSAPQTV
jgi:hypothetical protein